MPSKRRPPAPSLPIILTEMRAHRVILEDMRSQSRATIEAVETARAPSSGDSPDVCLPVSRR
jgi:hypothetical protein